MQVAPYTDGILSSVAAGRTVLQPQIGYFAGIFGIRTDECNLWDSFLGKISAAYKICIEADDWHSIGILVRL